jgi:3-hydroxybutyryl-CoA dehydratase
VSSDSPNNEASAAAPHKKSAPQTGQKFTYRRTFTVADVEAFTRVTGDVGRHHLQPDAQGRLIVHGLLTATLPTRIGGELDFLAREMQFEFIRPVYTGDEITVDVVCTEVVDEGRTIRLSADCVCRNQLGKEVLKAKTNGVIFK